MQTLNVGAGRTDEEYKTAEEQRLAELRKDCQTDANYFFIAAGLAALGTGLLFVQINFAVTIGAIDLFRFYERELLQLHPLLGYGVAALWVGILSALGWAALNGHRWAFLAGVVLYAADMILLIMTFSFWSFGVHGFFVFRWFQGLRALQELRTAQASH